MLPSTLGVFSSAMSDRNTVQVGDTRDDDSPDNHTDQKPSPIWSHSSAFREGETHPHERGERDPHENCGGGRSIDAPTAQIERSLKLREVHGVGHAYSLP